MMDNLHLQPTDKSPEIMMTRDGMIMIRGRGFILNSAELSQEVFDWIDNYILNPNEITCIVLSFEYLNSFTTIAIINILKKLRSILDTDKKLVVKWTCEDGDQDILERGEHISAAVNIPFEFIINK